MDGDGRSRCDGMCLLTLWARTDARAHTSRDTLGRPSRFRINEGEGCSAKRLGEG